MASNVFKLKKQQTDICFLIPRKTYGTEEVENSLKTQWKGELFLSHVSEHSRDVLIF